MQGSVFFYKVMYRVLNRLMLKPIVYGISYFLLSISCVFANEVMLEQDLIDKLQSRIAHNVQAYLGHSSFIVLVDIEKQKSAEQEAQQNEVEGQPMLPGAEMFYVPDNATAQASTLKIKAIKVSLVINLYVDEQQEQYLISLAKKSMGFSKKRGDAVVVTRKHLNKLSIERWVYENVDFLYYAAVIFLLLLCLLLMFRRWVIIEKRSKVVSQGYLKTESSPAKGAQKVAIQDKELDIITRGKQNIADRVEAERVEAD